VTAATAEHLRVVVDGLPVPILHPPAKTLRAVAVAAHLRVVGHDRVVCFTSGNAAQALRDAGLDVLAVGAGQELQPGRWWQLGEIARVWPDRFDATSGHLPLPLMVALAHRLRDHLGEIAPGPWLVPTGSGETLCALGMAYPGADLWALTHLDTHTDHHPGMPLAPLVAARRVVDARVATVLPC